MTAPSSVTQNILHFVLHFVGKGDCTVDSLTVALPGGQSPPVICGYNTGQHMFVPASDQCNSINIDIDTGTTTTIRKWQIKVKSRNLSKQTFCL